MRSVCLAACLLLLSPLVLAQQNPADTEADARPLIGVGSPTAVVDESSPSPLSGEGSDAAACASDANANDSRSGAASCPEAGSLAPPDGWGIDCRSDLPDMVPNFSCSPTCNGRSCSSSSACKNGPCPQGVCFQGKCECVI